MEPQRLASALATTALGANLVWLLAIAYLHLAERSMDPTRRYLSEYVLTESGWVMYLAFAAMSLGGLSLGTGLLATGWQGVPLGLVLLGFGVAVGAAGWFPTDPSTAASLSISGERHNQAAYYVYRLLAASALVGLGYVAFGLALTRRADLAWIGCALAVLGGFALTNYLWELLPPGVAQRLLFAGVFAWLSLVALRLLEGAR